MTGWLVLGIVVAACLGAIAWESKRMAEQALDAEESDEEPAP